MDISVFFDDKVDILTELFEDFLGPIRKNISSKHELCFDCPVCSAEKGVYYDGKGNLSINYKKGKYHCWACQESHGTRGRIKSLFKKYANNDTYRKFNDAKFIFYNDDEEEYTPYISPEITLPSGSINLTLAKGRSYVKDAYRYLKMRNIGDDLIEKYNLHYGGDGYDYRIILPSYNIDSQLNFYLGRSILKKPFMKYKNIELPKEEIIFNEHLINWNKTVFLVEGGYDHMPLPNSIPLLGKVLYDKLFNEIYYKARNNVVIALDPDAKEDVKKIFNKLDSGRLYKKIFYVDFPEGHDVSKINELYGFEGLKSYVTKWKRFNS
jgi:transcription elongation factor Elf1